MHESRSCITSRSEPLLCSLGTFGALIVYSLSIIDMSDNISKKKQWGLVYQCVACSDKIHKDAFNEKRHVAHVYKYHVSLDQAPFYCSLCHFITSRQTEIRYHLQNYGRHLQELETLKRRNIKPLSPKDYIHHSATPKRLTIGKREPGDKNFDLLKLSPEESKIIWSKREQKKKDTTAFTKHTATITTTII